jgi:1-aminocyclopropane-1-carboxylate deaminase/D-cysteine desulfhydrase-like pyridoxal-dependent ACC family enzyme
MAMTIGEAEGIHLDHTYTAKAFATALELAGHSSAANRTAVTRLEVSLRNSRKAKPLRVLYWHTLAATPLGPLLARGPAGPALPERLRMLLQGG